MCVCESVKHAICLHDERTFFFVQAFANSICRYADTSSNQKVMFYTIKEPVTINVNVLF